MGLSRSTYYFELSKIDEKQKEIELVAEALMVM